jgi:hypothetical protein
MEMKKCTKCGVIKSVDQFSKLTKSKDGLQYGCKQCQDALVKAWYAANRVKKIAQDAKRRLDNIDKYLESERSRREKVREQERARCITWYYANRDHVAEAGKAYRLSHADAESKRIKEWSDNNRECLNDRELKRIAARVRATPTWANLGDIQAVYDRAENMRRETGIKYEVDHIIPMGSKKVQGLHIASNLQIITGLENRKKGNRVWPDMP